LINESKLVILLASLCSGLVGYLWLNSFGQPLDTDEDVDAMDFAE
jgi:hypothetical protein